MGAKASTANGDDSGTSHGDRSFASGNGSDSVHTAGNPGFSILRSLPSAVANDRQRARSLSSVPDGHDGNSNSASPRFDITDVLEADSSSNDDQILDSPTVTANISLGRVYSAHSLPAHIWPFNGMYCLF
jgi:E3 ubiquitin-protein ligase ZNRF1/2